MNTELPQILTYALGFTATFKYLLLLVGVIVEGPILMVACGFFIRLGLVDLLPTFLVLLSGDLIADVFWYFIGFRYAEPLFRKHGGMFGISYENFEKVQGLFREYHDRILLISKVTIGFGMALATLIVAGATRVPFRRYMVLNAIGEVVLVLALLALGYVFGELYHNIARGFRDVFAISAIVVVALGLYGFANYMKGKIINHA